MAKFFSFFLIFALFFRAPIFAQYIEAQEKVEAVSMISVIEIAKRLGSYLGHPPLYLMTFIMGLNTNDPLAVIGAAGAYSLKVSELLLETAQKIDDENHVTLGRLKKILHEAAELLSSATMGEQFWRMKRWGSLVGSILETSLQVGGIVCDQLKREQAEAIIHASYHILMLGLMEGMLRDPMMLGDYEVILKSLFYGGGSLVLLGEVANLMQKILGLELRIDGSWLRGAWGYVQGLGERVRSWPSLLGQEEQGF